MNKTLLRLLVIFTLFLVGILGVELLSLSRWLGEQKSDFAVAAGLTVFLADLMLVAYSAERAFHYLTKKEKNEK